MEDEFLIETCKGAANTMVGEYMGTLYKYVKPDLTPEQYVLLCKELAMDKVQSILDSSSGENDGFYRNVLLELQKI
jgi:hypothetical protein